LEVVGARAGPPPAEYRFSAFLPINSKTEGFFSSFDRLPVLYVLVNVCVVPFIIKGCAFKRGPFFFPCFREIFFRKNDLTLFFLSVTRSWSHSTSNTPLPMTTNEAPRPFRVQRTTLSLPRTKIDATPLLQGCTYPPADSNPSRKQFLTTNSLLCVVDSFSPGLCKGPHLRLLFRFFPVTEVPPESCCWLLPCRQGEVALSLGHFPHGEGYFSQYCFSCMSARNRSNSFRVILLMTNLITPQS